MYCSKLDEKLRELVGPQIITIRQDVAIAKVLILLLVTELN